MHAKHTRMHALGCACMDARMHAGTRACRHSVRMQRIHLCMHASMHIHARTHASVGFSSVFKAAPA